MAAHDPLPVPPEPPAIPASATVRLDEERLVGGDAAAGARDLLASPSRSSPWSLPAGQALFLAAFAITVLVVCGLRLYRLDTLQADFYGDIAIVWEYVDWILDGKWPTHFFLSAGPLYHYLIAPVIAVAGQTYLGIKIASVLVSVATLAVIWVLARRLVDDHFALIALFVTGVASWLLVFGRLGNSQVVTPLLILLPCWLAVRHLQAGGVGNLMACGATAALGFYCYPATFVHAPVMLVVLVALRFTAPRRVTTRDLAVYVASAAVFAVPFLGIVAQDRANFFDGYIGGKLEAAAPFSALAGNVGRALIAFHWRGDGIGRSNPPLEPHLDAVSGAFMLLGLVFWLRRPQRQWAPVVLLPFVLLQIPSVLVLQSPGEVPSASRTLAAAPFACLLVAGGVYMTARFLSRRFRPWLGPAVVAPLLAAILCLNVHRYFVLYLDGLPYHNTPIGRLIRDHIERLPPGTEAHLVGCCWESSMPEPKGIEYELPPERKLHYWPYPHHLTCESLESVVRPTVLIWSFRESLPGPGLADCDALVPAQVYASPQGLPAFSAAPLLGAQTAGPAPVNLGAAPPQPATVFGSFAGPFTIVAGELVTRSLTAAGRPISITHSRLDLGTMDNLFDGNRETLVRGEADNPFILELRFTEAPRDVAALRIELGAMVDFAVLTTVERVGSEPATSEELFVGLPGEPVLELDLPGDASQPLVAARIAILDRRGTPGEGYHVHIRGLELVPGAGDAEAPPSAPTTPPHPAGGGADSGAERAARPR